MENWERSLVGIEMLKNILECIEYKMKNKAIFLDRDWTINYDFSYVYKISYLKLLDGVKEGLYELKKWWYKLIIITNQSWIWRWYYTIDDCNRFNNELENQLWLEFDWIYICPHSPDDNCKCRKPKTLLVEKAIRDFDLDINQCYFVWDKESDVQTGINIWCKTVLIENNQYECNIKSDFLCSSISKFSTLLKKK